MPVSSLMEASEKSWVGTRCVMLNFLFLLSRSREVSSKLTRQSPSRITLKKRINDEFTEYHRYDFLFKMFSERKTDATISFTDVVQLMGAVLQKQKKIVLEWRCSFLYPQKMFPIHHFALVPKTFDR